jgi:energy-coupling factor transporter transmembrane protein EcfT
MHNIKLITKKYTYILLLIGLLLIILVVPPLLVSIKYSKVINFAPEIFINEYLKFFGSVILLLVGFLLVNVYWDGRVERERHEILYNATITHLERISKLIWDIGELQDRHLNTREEENAREKEIYSNITRLTDANNSIFLLSNQIIRTKDKYLFNSITNYLRDIYPLIQRLSEIRDYSPINDILRRLTRDIGVGTRDILNLLKEGNGTNEPYPPR